MESVTSSAVGRERVVEQLGDLKGGLFPPGLDVPQVAVGVVHEGGKFTQRQAAVVSKVFEQVRESGIDDDHDRFTFAV